MPGFNPQRISATLGPACNNPHTIRAMMEAGVGSFRINFSQGSLADHQALLDIFTQAKRDFNGPADVIGDLCGPRFRIGRIQGEHPIQIDAGKEVTIITDCELGSAETFGTNYEHLSQDVEAGQRILIDEGHICLRVISIEDDRVQCEVLTGGKLQSFKGINLPDSILSAPALTDQDWQYVWWAIDNKIDYLAQSFVRQPHDIHPLQEALQKAGGSIHIITKIETAQAVQHLEAIIQASDIVLIARGDLGVELGLAYVPLVQQRIVDFCKAYGKPMILATHILHSMIQHPEPTRAEVADIAHAIAQGIDTLMLTGETAIGQYPLEGVRTLRHLIETTEGYGA